MLLGGRVVRTHRDCSVAQHALGTEFTAIGTVHSPNSGMSRRCAGWPVQYSWFAGLDAAALLRVIGCVGEYSTYAFHIHDHLLYSLKGVTCTVNFAQYRTHQHRLPSANCQVGR